jgi:hypothetical protein
MLASVYTSLTLVPSSKTIENHLPVFPDLLIEDNQGQYIDPLIEDNQINTLPSQ